MLRTVINVSFVSSVMIVRDVVNVFNLFPHILIFFPNTSHIVVADVDTVCLFKGVGLKSDGTTGRRDRRRDT